MFDKTTERRLAAIMFSDMEGYTAMMEQDELRTMEKINWYREVLNREVADHQGEVLENKGDGSLSIFPSAVEAVRCAINIQLEMKWPQNVPLRIGIHSGDIAFNKNREIYGDAVNLASRIESFSVPGAVLISEKVYDEIKNQPELPARSFGFFQMKNVRRPVEVFAIDKEGLSLPQQEELHGKGKWISLTSEHGVSPDEPKSDSEYQLLFPPYELFKKFLEENDRKLNQLLPEGLISPKEEHRSRAFSSEKLLTSLIYTGLPVYVAIEVLEKIEGSLKELLASHKKTRITTAHIRKIIYELLNNLDADKYGGRKIQKWGESYARRFGNPNGQTRVMLGNGEERDVDYQFFTEILIPDLIEKCYETAFEDLNKVVPISSKSINNLAREIMEKVRFLNLHIIDYETLLGLSYNLASQPPQPWLAYSEKEASLRMIKYNLAKAKETQLILSDYLAQRELDGPQASDNNIVVMNIVERSAKECIVYIATAILINYRLFIGSGQLRPLNNLYKYLSLFKSKDGNKFLWEKTNLVRISDDLNTIGKNFNEFYRLVEKLHAVAQNTIRQNYLRLIQSSLKFYEIGYELIACQIAFNNELEILKKNSADWKKLPSVIYKIFSHIQGFSLSDRERPDPDRFSIVHNIDSRIFHDIKTVINVKVYPSRKPVTKKQLQSCLNGNLPLRKKYSNTLFVISNQALQIECYDYISATLDEDSHLYYFTLNDLFRVFDAKDKLKSLEQYMVAFQGRLHRE